MKTNSSSPSHDEVNPMSEPARFGRVFGGIYRQWRRLVDVGFKHLDLSAATHHPLLVLYEQGAPMLQKDLAHALGLDTSSLVRVLEQLRERALVEWTSSPIDRRTKFISLTPQGADIAAQILEKCLDIERAILVDLSPEELAVTRRALHKITQRIETL
jgi:MarR family transcriptional regulator for hemolysin